MRTAILKKSDKAGFLAMRYISLLPVLQKFNIRSLQTAVRRERKHHETNILGYEPGRSIAGVTATLGQVLSKKNWLQTCHGLAKSPKVRSVCDGWNNESLESNSWKEKNLTIVAGPYTEYIPGDVVEIISKVGKCLSGEWWRAWRHWARGWTRVLGGQPVAQILQNQLHVLREERLALRPQTAGQECAWLRCFMVLVNGPTRSQCSWQLLRVLCLSWFG